MSLACCHCKARCQSVKEDVAKIERSAEADSDARQDCTDCVVTTERWRRHGTGKQPGTETRELWTSHKASQQRCSWTAAVVPRAGQGRHEQKLLGSTILADWSISYGRDMVDGGTRARSRAQQTAANTERLWVQRLSGGSSQQHMTIPSMGKVAPFKEGGH